jgi:hypothetical protein
MENNNTIYPTYSCFDDAMEFIDYVAQEYKNEDTSVITLVHGTIKGDDGNLHAHAWCEESGLKVAIFAGFLRGEKVYFYSPLDEFYEKYRVQEKTHYTIKEALGHNLRTIHFGPWEPKYVALCGIEGDVGFIGSGEMRIGTVGKLPTRKETTHEPKEKVEKAGKVQSGN